MSQLNINVHKRHLAAILLDIYKDTTLGTNLGFKGGTAAMFFYNLPRFSVDLDFDLTVALDPGSEELNKFITKMHYLLTKKYEIKDYNTKYNTLFWLIRYDIGSTKIKVEVSTRTNPYNHYELKNFYGSSIKLLKVGDMIAHKMVALLERKYIANRDIFDIHFFLSSKYSTYLNEEIIEYRTGKKIKDFYRDMIDFLNKIDNKNILNGLGELITNKQKYWVKNNLLKETIGLVEIAKDFSLK